MTPVILADNIELGQISVIAGAIGVIFFVAAIVRVIRSRHIRTRASNREQAKANYGTEENPVSYSHPYVLPEGQAPASSEPPPSPQPQPSAIEPQPQPLTAPPPPRSAPARSLGADAREEAASDYEHFIWE